MKKPDDFCIDYSTATIPNITAPGQDPLTLAPAASVSVDSRTIVVCIIFCATLRCNTNRAGKSRLMRTKGWKMDVAAEMAKRKTAGCCVPAVRFPVLDLFPLIRWQVERITLPYLQL